MLAADFEYRWIHYIGSVGGVGGRRVWMEQEVKVASIRRFEEGAGRTGKGVLHFWEVDPHTGKTGQYHAVDLEDVIAVNRGSVLGRKK